MKLRNMELQVTSYPIIEETLCVCVGGGGPSSSIRDTKMRVVFALKKLTIQRGTKATW